MYSYHRTIHAEYIKCGQFKLRSTFQHVSIPPSKMWSIQSIIFFILLQGFCYSFDEANVIDLQPESSDIFPLADSSSPSDINPAAISSSSSRKPGTTTPSSGYTTSSPSYCGIGGPSAQFDNEDEEDDDINSRIVGGSETRPNEFPWQAFVRVTTETGLVKYCGGSLIANRWILTANHCLRSPRFDKIFTLKTVNIFVKFWSFKIQDKN